jgi:hypothetical protein
MSILSNWLWSLWNVLQALARCLWRWGRILWVCRVAVLGVVISGTLLSALPQGRDLFADLRITPFQWLLFFIMVFIWAGIVHKSARRALQNDDWVCEARLGLLENPVLRPTPDVATVRDALQKKFWRPSSYIPRFLSFLVFLFVGIAVWRVDLNLGTAKDGVPEAAQAVRSAHFLLAVTCVACLIYAWMYWPKTWRFWEFREFGDWRLNPGPGWKYEPPLLAGTAPLFASRLPPGYTRPTPPVPSTWSDWLWTAARWLTVVLLAITIYDPHFLAASYPRLFLIPLLFAGGVILIGEIAAWSMRWRTPLVLGIAVASLVAVLWTESFHATRWIDVAVKPSNGTGEDKQISMEAAIQRWKAANDCIDKKCPQPILIAGAGGASRAGFYTATVVGALMDLGLDPENAKIYGDIRNRIFALSTVSGGSAGAAVIRAAMLDAADRGTPNVPPCRTAGTGSWFGQPLMAANKNYDPTKNWRDCFQAIMAGDFLSPIFVALAYRDSFPFTNPFTRQPAWADRAVLLEQAIERRYHRFTSTDGSSMSCPDRPEPAAPGYEGMCRPFGHHPDAKRAGAWVPIFFLNGASVFTGRRIVVSDVATTSCSPPDAAFMAMAYDLNDLRNRPTDTAPPAGCTDAIKPAGKDDYIRLSTAITMSARFPVVSPQGVLLDKHGTVVDQIVDGGYFENDGIATIIEVVKALQKHDLIPVVVRIVNEPGKPDDPAADRTRPPPQPKAGEHGLFDDYIAIVRALNATRQGHEDQVAASLRELLGQSSRLYEIGVYEFLDSGPKSAPQLSMSPQSNPVCRREVKGAAKMEQVSMSWWMSQPVQAYLDAQLCLPANWARLACELRGEQKC